MHQNVTMKHEEAALLLLVLVLLVPLLAEGAPPDPVLNIP